MGVNNRKWICTIDIIDFVWIIEAAVIISLATLSLHQYYIIRLYQCRSLTAIQI